MRTIHEDTDARTGNGLRSAARSTGLRRVFGGLLLLALLHNPFPALHAVGLAWDPSPDPNVVGYAIYYGTNSGSYQTRIPVGGQTNATIQIPTNGASYYFVATAYTVDGLESLPSNEVSYVPPINLPTIMLNSPTGGAGYPSPATISFAATVTANSHTITKVQFYNDATLLGEDLTAPYSFTWSNVGAGNYNLSARVVYDADGTASSAVVTLAVTNPPPSITLTAPLNGASYTAPATINLAANITVNGHAITKVEFYNGPTLLGEATAAPYVFTWSNVGAGNYSPTANVVYDMGSTVTSTPTSVIVTNNSAGGLTRIGLRSVTTGTAVLSVTGQTGYTYDIEATEDFTAWTVIGTVTLDAGGSVDFTDLNAASYTKRFYRTQQKP